VDGLSAEDDCVNQGGHLTSIVDANEAAFLVSILSVSQLLFFIYYLLLRQMAAPDIFKTVIYILHSYTKIKNIKNRNNMT